MQLTVTRHRYGHVDVDLEVVPDAFVDCKRVVRFSKEVLFELEPDQDSDYEG